MHQKNASLQKTFIYDCVRKIIFNIQELHTEPRFNISRQSNQLSLIASRAVVKVPDTTNTEFRLWQKLIQSRTSSMGIPSTNFDLGTY
jgi:hypothetical protein